MRSYDSCIIVSLRLTQGLNVHDMRSLVPEEFDPFVIVYYVSILPKMDMLSFACERQQNKLFVIMLGEGSCSA